MTKSTTIALTGSTSADQRHSTLVPTCSQRTKPDEWTLDKVAVLEDVNRQIAVNRPYLCPAFSRKKVREWLDALPDAIQATEDGWIGDLEEINRVLHDHHPGASFGLSLGPIEITVESARRGLGKPPL